MYSFYISTTCLILNRVNVRLFPWGFFFPPLSLWCFTWRLKLKTIENQEENPKPQPPLRLTLSQTSKFLKKSRFQMDGGFGLWVSRCQSNRLLNSWCLLHSLSLSFLIFFLFVILFLDLTLTLLNSYLVMPFDSIGNDGKGVLFNLMGILWWLLILKMRTLDVVSYWSCGF